jgi:UDP-N-acetylmuramoylalanine-D-glutamate ligase
LHTHILLETIRGGHCTVLGYGVSNRPLVDWLMSHGAASVTVRDKRDAAAM